MIPTRLCLHLSLACALPLGAAEQEPQAKKPAPKPEPSALVEVTAPLPSEPLVTVLDAKAPRQPVPAHDGADYLKSIPGFSVIRKGGTDGDPVLRGMAGSRLNILLDGEQLLGGCGMRMDPPTAYVFPESYDRITVVKGPQTVLYGPGNSAGLVRFERTHERFQKPGFRGVASLMGGSFGRNDEVLDATGGNSTFYVRGIGTRSHSDDYEDGKGTPSTPATPAGAPTQPLAGPPAMTRGWSFPAPAATGRPPTPTAPWMARNSSARTSASAGNGAG